MTNNERKYLCIFPIILFKYIIPNSLDPAVVYDYVNQNRPNTVHFNGPCKLKIVKMLHFSSVITSNLSKSKSAEWMIQGECHNGVNT